MKLNPARAGKWASLSALGAGALVVGTGRADAASILSFPDTCNLTRDYDVIGNTGCTDQTIPSFGNVGVSFFALEEGKFGHKTGNGFRTTEIGNRVRHPNPSFGSRFYVARDSIVFSGLGGLKFATNGGMLRLFAFGAAFPGGNAFNSKGTVAFRSNWTTYIIPRLGTTTFFRKGFSGSAPNGHTFGPASFTNQYAMFEFTFNSQAYQGWLELSVSQPGFVPQPPFKDSDNHSVLQGPNMTVLGGAFEQISDGVVLHAGDEPAGTPEPGTLPTTSLGALVLGAAGIRRWRAARRTPVA